MDKKPQLIKVPEMATYSFSKAMNHIQSAVYYLNDVKHNMGTNFSGKSFVKEVLNKQQWCIDSALRRIDGESEKDRVKEITQDAGIIDSLHTYVVVLPQEKRDMLEQYAIELYTEYCKELAAEEKIKQEQSK